MASGGLLLPDGEARWVVRAEEVVVESVRRETLELAVKEERFLTGLMNIFFHEREREGSLLERCKIVTNNQKIPEQRKKSKDTEK